MPGKLALKQYKANQLLDRYGKQLIQIKDKWQEISYQILTALELALSPTVNAIKGAFDWVVKLIEKLKTPEVVGVWESLSGVFSELGKSIAAISIGSAGVFGQGGALANAARSFRDFFSERRYDWASKLQPQATFGGFRNEFGQSKSLQGLGWQAQDFRMNSGLPQLKGFGDRQFSLSAPITPDYHENALTRLRWDFESLGEYIKSMLPGFKKFGENMGLVAAMNFEMISLSFKTLENTAKKLGDAFNSLKKIADEFGPAPWRKVSRVPDTSGRPQFGPAPWQS